MNKNSPLFCETYDVIIVGLGVAGSVLANRLTEVSNLNVLVLEAGRDDSRLEEQLLPVDQPNPYANNTYNDAFTNQWSKLLRTQLADGTELFEGFAQWQHTPLLRDEKSSLSVFYPRGSTWGGSSAIHGGIHLRGTPETYDSWAIDNGNTMWDYNGLLPYFKKNENRTQTLPIAIPYYDGIYRPVNATYEGLDGPLPLLYATEEDQVYQMLRNSLLANGYLGSQIGPAVDPALPTSRIWYTPHDLEYLDQFGTLFSSLNPYGSPVFFPRNAVGIEGIISRLEKISSSASYIYPIQKRNNLTIKSECFVTRIIVDRADNKAVGLEYLEGWNVYETGRNMNTARAGLGGTPTDSQFESLKSKMKGVRRVYAKYEIILCGGAFNTPQLLLLSGIGPKEHLKEKKIHRVIDLPGVGRHLTDHPEVGITVSLNKTTDVTYKLTNLRVPIGLNSTWRFKSDGDTGSTGTPDFYAHVIAGGAPWQEGTPADACASVGMRILNPPYLVPSPIQSFGLAFTTQPNRYMIYRAKLENNSSLYSPTLIPTYQIPPSDMSNYVSFQLGQGYFVKSEGFVELNSCNPTDKPKIITNLVIENDDFSRWTTAFKHFATVVQGMTGSFPGSYADQFPGTGGFSGWINPLPNEFLTTGLVYDGTNFDENKFRTWFFNRVSGHHAAGTCRMGPNPQNGDVVDQRCKVYGLCGLRVVDASIMPSLPNANPVATVYAMAEKAADLIKEDIRKERKRRKNCCGGGCLKNHNWV